MIQTLMEKLNEETRKLETLRQQLKIIKAALKLNWNPEIQTCLKKLQGDEGRQLARCEELLLAFEAELEAQAAAA